MEEQGRASGRIGAMGGDMVCDGLLLIGHAGLIEAAVQTGGLGRME